MIVFEKKPFIAAALELVLMDNTAIYLMDNIFSIYSNCLGFVFTINSVILQKRTLRDADKPLQRTNTVVLIEFVKFVITT